MRSGYISNGHLWIAGINGYNWSALASSKHNSGSTTSSAYYLVFDASGTYSSHGPNYRWDSFPLCYLVIGGGDQANEHRGRAKGKYYHLEIQEGMH